MDADTALRLVGVVAAGLLLLLVTAVEATLVYLSGTRARALAARDGAPASLLRHYVHERTRLHSALRFGRTLALIGGGVVLTTLMADWLGGGWQVALAAALATLTLAAVVEGIGDLVVARHTEWWALRCAPLASGLRFLFRPPAWLLDRPGDLLAHLAPVPKLAAGAEEQELLRLVEIEESNGAIEPEERQMIRGVIKLVDTTAREIMVPRIDMVAVEANASMADVERIIVERGYSRIPLYEGTIDNIIGVIYAKDVLRCLAEGRQPESLKALARPPYFIPETKKVDELLTELRQHKIHIAIVVDEYGGTAGLVTTEDILEEIVGEIEDEYDVEEAAIERLSEHEAVLDARVGIEALNEMFGLDLANEDYDTVGGIILTQLGRVPVAGDEVQVDGIRLHVLSVIGRRIKKVRVSRLQAEPAKA